MNDLVLTDHHILVEAGVFELVGFEQLSKQVDELGKYLLSIDVTEDNIVENKRLVAQVRKMCDGLNRERIDFKNEYLKPYKHLEEQVKSLTERVNKYEAVIREQIREIEEKERDDKRNEIKEIFNLRLRGYGSETLYPFEDFIKPQHLNKSYSIKKVENDMVEWFETRKSNLNVLSDFADNGNLDKTEVINHYVLTNNFIDTIDYYNQLSSKKDNLQQAIENTEKTRKSKTRKPQFVKFKINKADQQKVCDLLRLSGVEYEIL